MLHESSYQMFCFKNAYTDIFWFLQTLKIVTYVPDVCLKNLHSWVLVKRYSIYNQFDGSLKLWHVAEHLVRKTTYCITTVNQQSAVSFKTDTVTLAPGFMQGNLKAWQKTHNLQRKCKQRCSECSAEQRNSYIYFELCYWLEKIQRHRLGLNQKLPVWETGEIG